MRRDQWQIDDESLSWIFGFLAALFLVWFFWQCVRSDATPVMFEGYKSFAIFGGAPLVSDRYKIKLGVWFCIIAGLAFWFYTVLISYLYFIG